MDTEREPYTLTNAIDDLYHVELLIGEDDATRKARLQVADILRRMDFEILLAERKYKNNGMAAMIGLERIDELEKKLQRERDAANKLLASIAAWVNKSAGQTLPTELSEAIFVFEDARHDTHTI